MVGVGSEGAPSLALPAWLNFFDINLPISQTR